MTTTDTDALTERIARILNDEGWTFEGVHEPGDYDECEECRRVVDPIAARVAREVAGEVSKAQADAWDRAVRSLSYSDGSPVEVLSNPNPYRETGDSDEHR